MSLTVEGVSAQTQQAPPPTPEPPKPAKGKLPKGMEQTQQTPPPQQQQTTYSSNEGKSRKEILEQYENDYLQRIEQEQKDDEKAYQELVEAEAKARSQKTRGRLPKGFEAKTEPEPSKSSKGTLPKGY